LVDGPLVVERAEVFDDSEFFAAGTADLRGGLRLAMTSCLSGEIERGAH
jgi:hypothetical protein